MKKLNQTDYFKPKNYFSFQIKKLQSGEAFRTVSAFVSKIRKFTLISAIFKASAIVITLLEKSAILLLIASIVLLTLPVIVLGAITYGIVCVFKYFTLNKEMQNWFEDCQNAIVFITKTYTLSKTGEKMFKRYAKNLSTSFDFPVIIVCKDRFVAAKWLSKNLLAVREDYFFILKRFYIEKKHVNTTYIVL